MACDMCGKKTCDLMPLLDGYKTDDIQHICGDCSRLVNDHVWKIRRVTDGMCKTAIRRFMENWKADKAS